MKRVAILIVVLLLLSATPIVARGLAGWNMPPVAENDGEAIRQQCGEVNVLTNDWDPENGELVLVDIFYTESLQAKWEQDGLVSFCLEPVGKRAGRLGYLVADDQGLMDVGYLYVYWL